MSVIPGSETLWSVHSGERCWIYRLASSTNCWKRRSSRLGEGRAMSLDTFRGGDHVEREDEVARVVGAADGVPDIDQQHRRVVLGGGHLDVRHLDARLPAVQAGAHLVADPS